MDQERDGIIKKAIDDHKELLDRFKARLRMLGELVYRKIPNYMSPTLTAIAKEFEIDTTDLFNTYEDFEHALRTVQNKIQQMVEHEDYMSDVVLNHIVKQMKNNDSHLEIDKNAFLKALLKKVSHTGPKNVEIEKFISDARAAGFDYPEFKAIEKSLDAGKKK